MTALRSLCRWVLTGCIAAGLVLRANASDAPPIESFALKNGMQVVLLTNTRVPAITHMLWYRVGAADDFPGRSGLAHYNEHMMFQGTKTTTSGEYNRVVASKGGRANAFTSHDYTAYYVDINKQYLPLIMQMEADRMLNLAPTEANFLKEREVIIEERRMSIENRPDALLDEELHAALYRNHPYHNPVIGWMHEMQALTREDVLAFHTQFYHPANAVLVVAGDITRAELEPLAERYYGSLPAGEKYIRHWRSEPPQRGPRTLTMTSENVHQPELIRIYSAASVGQDDKALVLPSFVLAQIMGASTTSRLYQSLVVRQKLAAGVDADFGGFNAGPGEFSITAVPAEGVSLAQLEAALDKEIADLKGKAVTPDELARAKVLLAADTIYARDGLENIARTLGAMVMVGVSPDYFNQWPDLIDKVSAEEVHQAALATFDPDKSVTGYLLPKKGDAK